MANSIDNLSSNEFEWIFSTFPLNLKWFQFVPQVDVLRFFTCCVVQPVSWYQTNRIFTDPYDLMFNEITLNYKIIFNLIRWNVRIIFILSMKTRKVIVKTKQVMHQRGRCGASSCAAVHRSTYARRIHFPHRSKNIKSTK